MTDDDIPLIEEFAEAILEYLYRAPGKVAAVKSTLQARIAQNASAVPAQRSAAGHTNR